MPVDPGLGELIRRAIAARLVDVHTSLPARVLRYYPATQKVDVEIVLKRALPSVDGAPVLEKLPELANVPVLFPRGGGAFLRFKLVQGDWVTLFFSERSIDAWQATGEVSDPADRRLHGLSGARAYPGGCPDPEAIADAEGGDVAAGRIGGVQTHWVDDEVRLTSATDSEFLARADRVLAELEAIVNTFNTHVHVETGGSTAVPTTLMGAPSDPAADKVKGT